MEEPGLNLQWTSVEYNKILTFRYRSNIILFMAYNRETETSKSHNSGCGTGCATLPAVATIGLVFSLLGVALGGGCSVRIPLTESNISVAGSIGSKEKTLDALPNYLRDKLASNYNFINSSSSLTLGPAQGTGIFVIGKQPGAPAADLNINFK